MGVNLFELAVGAYLLSPVSPEDALTAGATVVPSAVAGGALIFDGLLNEGRLLDSLLK